MPHAGARSWSSRCAGCEPTERLGSHLVGLVSTCMLHVQNELSPRVILGVRLGHVWLVESCGSAGALHVGRVTR